MSKLKVEKVPTSEDRTLPIFAEFDEMLDRVRDRAYSLFCTRGCDDGHALEDWLTAERELCLPAAELAEQDAEFELNVALPGFEPDEIKVTATPRELIIKAAHLVKKEKESEEQTGKVHWSELRRDDAFRRIELPAEVDVDKISAELDRGVLTIEAPKTAAKATQTKRVKVTSAA
jgi:HSP20 family protein